MQDVCENRVLSVIKKRNIGIRQGAKAVVRCLCMKVLLCPELIGSCIGPYIYTFSMLYACKIHAWNVD